MKYSPVNHDRRSIRLLRYDYSQPGEYFITICTHNRECLFDEIVNGEIRLNQLGHIVNEEWNRTSLIRPNVELAEYVIMPNHLHGIIILDDSGRGTLQRAPTVEQFGKPTRNSIPTIIRLFKSAATKRINELRNTPREHVWQRNYYEHIIHGEKDSYAIREYVINNPLKWQYDHENLNAIPNITPAQTLHFPKQN